MPFQLFQYPLPADPDLSELNSFLGSHRISTVQRELITTPAGPLLVFIVEYIRVSQHAEGRAAGNGRIDYREVFTEEEFSLFNELRSVRKRLADTEGVPVYAIFSNAQLASMVQRRCTTISDFNGIEGVGKARVEKYAEHFLSVLLTTVNDPSEQQPTPVA